MVDGVGVQGDQLKGPGQLEDSFNLALNLSWGHRVMGEGNVREPPQEAVGKENTSGDAPPPPAPPTSDPRDGGCGGELTQAGACVGALNDDVFAGVVED